MKLYEFFQTHEWTTIYLARNKSNEPIDPESDTACSWCMVGALYYIYGYNNPELHILEINILRKFVKKYTNKRFIGLGTVNDTYFETKDQVIEFLKEIDE